MHTSVRDSEMRETGYSELNSFESNNRSGQEQDTGRHLRVAPLLIRVTKCVE